jgi:hypothetical protein
MQDDTVRLSLADAVMEAWEKCYEVWSFGICVGFSASGSGTVTLTLKIQVFGNWYRWDYDIDGDKCIEAGYGPLKVKACVSQWSIESGSVRFRLLLTAEAFWQKVVIFDGVITIPLPRAEELEALESLAAETPRDLAPLLALLTAGAPAVKEVPSGFSTGESAASCRCGKG